jgi:hypothetical protein
MKIKYLALTLLLSSCYRDSNKSFLEKQGFTDVKICGYAWFACGRDDAYHTCFEAKNIKGNSVKGAVCEGFIFKNKTIRFED